MKKISFDLILKISSYLDIKTVLNLNQSNSRYKSLNTIFQVQRKKNAAIIIIRFFNKIKNNYKDLRLNRKGYLINYKKIYKYPQKYLNKRIQFISSFQYSPTNLRTGEIGEGILYYHQNTDAWFFNLDNTFYNYLLEEPLPVNHLLYQSFIKNKSLRVIID